MKKCGKDYIVFPLDVDHESEAKQLVGRLREHVGMFKIGLAVFIRHGPPLVTWVASQAGAKVFLDLKLHDIPATVSQAMRGIAALDVALTTVHCGESPAMLAAAVEGSQGKVGLLGVTVLTSVSAQDLTAAGYRENRSHDLTELVLHRASLAKSAGFSGVVCSGHEAALIKNRLGSPFLTVTPGIRPAGEQGAGDDQRRVMTPAQAVAQGADLLVIGRPIRDAPDPAAAAQHIAMEIDAIIDA